MTTLTWVLLLQSALAGAAPAPPAEDRQTTFFVGRVRYSANDGNDCGDVGQSMAQIVSQVAAIPVQRERKVTLNDATLFETPFLFMNGHNDFMLSEAELENLRTYFDHGGFLFASGCCTNPGFPVAWRRELSRVFANEKVRALAYEHPIYRSFYKIERVKSLHRNQEVHLEALFYQGRIVAVMCEDGLCCAFAMANRCNVGRGVSPEDGRKLALNVAIYAMTH
jgi:hypothetical protein